MEVGSIAYVPRGLPTEGYKGLLQSQPIEDLKEDWDWCPTEEAIVPHGCPVEELVIRGRQTKRDMCVCH